MALHRAGHKAARLLWPLFMSKSYCLSLSPLQRVRELQAPTAESTESGEAEQHDWWDAHAGLLQAAWREWEGLNQHTFPSLDVDEMVDPQLLRIVQAAWQEPSHEDALRHHWVEVAPDVWRGQLFQPDELSSLRTVIDAASYHTGIPTRRPNGMNRYGLILAPSDIDGAVNLSVLETFYQQLTNLIRPIGRYFFAPYVGQGDDDESYAFTIRYKPDEDVKLNEHSDASLYTLNVNLNQPDEAFAGSSVYFVSDGTDQHYNVTFSPGEALLHRGMTRHAARPLSDGARTNLVIWWHGAHGYVRIAPYKTHEQMSATERWRKSVARPPTRRPARMVGDDDRLTVMVFGGEL